MNGLNNSYIFNKCIQRLYVYKPCGLNMARKERNVNGTIETTAWSHHLKDEPWPHLLEVLERIATSLEKLVADL